MPFGDVFASLGRRGLVCVPVSLPPTRLLRLLPGSFFALRPGALWLPPHSLQGPLGNLPLWAIFASDAGEGCLTASALAGPSQLAQAKVAGQGAATAFAPWAAGGQSVPGKGRGGHEEGGGGGGGLATDTGPGQSEATGEPAWPRSARERATACLSCWQSSRRPPWERGCWPSRTQQSSHALRLNGGSFMPFLFLFPVPCKSFPHPLLSRAGRMGRLGQQEGEELLGRIGPKSGDRPAGCAQAGRAKARAFFPPSLAPGGGESPTPLAPQPSSLPQALPCGC